MVFGFGSSKGAKSGRGSAQAGPSSQGHGNRPTGSSAPFQRPTQTVPVDYKRSNSLGPPAAVDTQLRRDQRPLPPGTMPVYHVNESTQYAVADCDTLLKGAPYPTNLEGKGRRPHAHKDFEDKFYDDKVRLQAQAQTHPPVQGHNGTTHPVMWAYPNTTKFDYSQQNRNGQMPANQGGREASGASRIVTDHKKNQLGMVTHPGQNGSFIRCKETRAPLRTHPTAAGNPARPNEAPTPLRMASRTWGKA